jgi:hypothetical protein
VERGFLEEAAYEPGLPIITLDTALLGKLMGMAVLTSDTEGLMLIINDYGRSISTFPWSLLPRSYEVALD